MLIARGTKLVLLIGFGVLDHRSPHSDLPRTPTGLMSSMADSKSHRACSPVTRDFASQPICWSALPIRPDRGACEQKRSERRVRKAVASAGSKSKSGQVGERESRQCGDVPVGPDRL